MINKDNGIEDPGRKTHEPTWSVWRRDDNNNVFLVQDGLTEAEALDLVREYERKGHKQTYWAAVSSSF